MSTKHAARIFLRDDLNKSGHERKAVSDGLSGKGFVRRRSDGRRSVDVAMSGKTVTATQSLRADGAPAPEIKLRRYFVEPTGKAQDGKVSSATYGVDMDRKSFEALVQKTAEETGLQGRKAVQATITTCLDQASTRKRELQEGDIQKFSVATPEGVVKGISRGRDRVRVDDLSFKNVPALEEPQRTRQDDRDERVREAARRLAEQDAEKPKKRKPGPRQDGGPEISD